ncbi:MAG TPA: hypothetical protein PKZ84_19430 [Anaerolineae bacterium]|nr:hypothetical protein [Anaerolineae bacterium]HQI86796.1 hypothetical protein [Anaerolineae bacterium]
MSVIDKDPHIAPSNHASPYFLWDYNLNVQQVHDLLREGATEDKAWLISRILNYATWDDIWRYVTVSDIHDYFDQLHFHCPQDRELWAYALERWSYGH